MAYDSSTNQVDIHPLIAENKVLSGSLMMANAWVKLLVEAFDALLHHGINYRTLPTYKDPSGLLDRALDPKRSFDTGVKAVLEYLENMSSDIRAAIRRKTFRQV